MSWEKVVNTRIWGVTGQESDIRMTAGDSSGGTFTGKANPLRGSLFWDRCMFVLQGVSVGGAATGGSFTVTIETDAIVGYTGMPIARATGIGPNSNSTIVMDSLHQSAASPLPTHLNIDITAGGSDDGLTANCHVIAKQYRGVLGSPAIATAERVIMGNMIKGTSDTIDFSGDEGVSADTTFTLGTSGTDLGLNKMRLWDNAMYWAVSGNTEAGEHDVDIIATVGGTTVSIASTGVAGALGVPDAKIALVNNFYGQTPNPSAIIWTEVGAGGVSDFRVVVMAKSGRGSMAKR
ncbi:hypothetical protein LCGC14_0866120 [marine sediment metagenome]|uniref:Uncharacterized protein n=1 Tax=marine sediment metagenome TaxID=412755 RepID=A0A0F9PRL9_9ZZZZ